MTWEKQGNKESHPCLARSLGIPEAPALYQVVRAEEVAGSRWYACHATPTSGPPLPAEPVVV